MRKEDEWEKTAINVLCIAGQGSIHILRNHVGEERGRGSQDNNDYAVKQADVLIKTVQNLNYFRSKMNYFVCNV